MKTIISSLLLLSWTCFCPELSAQQQNGMIREDGAYYIADQMPEYPGGIEAMLKYIESNIQYPREALTQKVQSRVYVQFVVNKNGKVSQAEISRGSHPLLDKEAIRVVSNMPKWIPGKNKGKKVPVIYTLPITFKITPSMSSISDIKNSNDTGTTLQGIWQICKLNNTSDNEKYSITAGPYMKILSTDNRFTNLALNTSGHVSVITSNGTYTQTSDSTYVESVSESIMNPKLSGKDITIHFKFLNANLLMISFQSVDPLLQGKEYWTRVFLPQPANQHN